MQYQEERHRSIGNGHSNNGPFVESIALAAKSMSFGSTNSGSNYFGTDFQERPTYSHYGLLGHTVEKCYKIHSYLLGYKTKTRKPVASQAPCSEMVSKAVPSFFLFFF